MPYTYLTFIQARLDLGRRLYDPDSKFWSDDEKAVYIKEALRTWNALSNFWRDDFVLDLQQGVTWYDITDTAVAPNTLRPITVLDTDLYDAIEYHLLEPATGATWTGSAQFNA